MDSQSSGVYLWPGGRPGRALDAWLETRRALNCACSPAHGFAGVWAARRRIRSSTIMDTPGNTPAGWIFFDAECRFCSATRRRWGPVFERRGFVWVPLQSPQASERLGMAPERLMAEIWLLPCGGTPVCGVEAWTHLMRRVWWLKPVGFVMNLPGLNRLAQTCYRWFARHRYTLSGRCRVQPPALKS